MNPETILYILGAIVAAYFALVIVAGVWKGWSAVKNIWFYTKKIGWLILIVIGFVVLVYSLNRKNKKKQEIQDRLAELKKIENKTNADIKEAERLEAEAKEIEKGIIETTDKFKEKVDELKKKPDKPQPGDAGRSSDDMTNAWK